MTYIVRRGTTHVMQIEYRIGDATLPHRRDPDEIAVIAHVCNDSGRWGAGFTKSIDCKWSEPRDAYRSAGYLRLGDVQFTRVDLYTAVVNMIAQSGTRSRLNPHPIVYDDLDDTLRRVRYCVESLRRDYPQAPVSVHMPRIGCGLGGGTWDRVEPMVQTQLADHDVRVVVYDLP